MLPIFSWYSFPHIRIHYCGFVTVIVFSFMVKIDLLKNAITTKALTFPFIKCCVCSMCFPFFLRTRLKKKLQLWDLSLSRAQLCPPECRLSCVDWIWAHLFLIFPPLLSELQLICSDSLLIPQLFLTPALLCTSIPILTRPSLPSFLASCLLLTRSPPLHSILFLFSDCYISVTADLPCCLCLVFPFSPLFPLVYQCNICPWSSFSIVSGTQRHMFLSLYIYIWAAYQQLLSMVFLYSLVCSFGKTLLNDACYFSSCQCCHVFLYLLVCCDAALALLYSACLSVCL